MKILQQDPTNNVLNDFFLKYGIWIAVALAGAALLTVIVLFIIAKVKDKKGYLPTEAKPELSERSKAILEALGGKENILEHSLNGSRLTLSLTDYNAVNEVKLNELGVDSVIKMSNKIILVIKDDISRIYQEMF